MGNTNKLAKGTKENSPPSKYNRRKTEPRPSPTTLRGIAEFTSTLNETFDLMQGLQDQIVMSGNVATLTSAELDLLQRALQRLCIFQTNDSWKNSEERASPEYDDVSLRYIENEYTTDSFSVERRGSVSPAIDLPSRSMSIHSSTLKSFVALSNLSQEVEDIFLKFHLWDFDLLSLREKKLIDNPLVVCVMHAMHLQGITSRTPLIKDERSFVEYLTRIEYLYFQNPYHNNWHAADVVQGMNYGLLHVPETVSFPPYARFAAILAAAVHDVGHLGVNNAFLISTSHQLALQFSDQSPLEMMHAQKAFSTLHQPGCNFMKEYDKDDKFIIRKMVITMVLQTDNAKHVTLLEGFTRLRVSGTLDISANDHQLHFLSLVLHSMDVSNVARPWHIGRKWLELILIEFYAQGDAEKISQIPVTPMMDRNSNVPVPKFQIGFINAIVKPLFVELSMNGVTVNDPIDCINETVSLWENIVANNSTLEDTDKLKNYEKPAFITDIEKNPTKTAAWLERSTYIRSQLLENLSDTAIDPEDGRFRAMTGNDMSHRRQSPTRKSSGPASGNSGTSGGTAQSQAHSESQAQQGSEESSYESKATTKFRNVARNLIRGMTSPASYASNSTAGSIVSTAGVTSTAGSNTPPRQFSDEKIPHAVTSPTLTPQTSDSVSRPVSSGSHKSNKSRNNSTGNANRNIIDEVSSSSSNTGGGDHV